jgi:hypothetical protein
MATDCRLIIVGFAACSLLFLLLFVLVAVVSCSLEFVS